MSRDRYFTALELENQPLWPTRHSEWHPHITMHYFGPLSNAEIRAIKDVVKPLETRTFRMVSRSIEKFGAGLALTFEPNADYAEVLGTRALMEEYPSVRDCADHTFPEFRMHMSLPYGFNASTTMKDVLIFKGPILLATRSVTVRA